MPVAFVLINTEIGAMEEVLKAVRKIDGVKEAYNVYGVYDIIAKVESKSMEQLKEVVTRNIRQISQVRSTQTMMVVEEK